MSVGVELQVFRSLKHETMLILGVCIWIEMRKLRPLYLTILVIMCLTHVSYNRGLQESVASLSRWDTSLKLDVVTCRLIVTNSFFCFSACVSVEWAYVVGVRPVLPAPLTSWATMLPNGCPLKILQQPAMISVTAWSVWLNTTRQGMKCLPCMR